MKGNKRRGYVLEHEVEQYWRNLGAECKRVFASGAYKRLGEDFEGDVQLEGHKIECKRRKDGFRELYKWLDQDDADLLVVRADRKKRLYILTEDLITEFATKMNWFADKPIKKKGEE